MDADDNNRYLPNETDEALDEIFVDVLRRAHEAVHAFISDEHIEQRLRQAREAAAESGDVPEWALDVPVDDPVMPNEYILDQHVALWAREEAEDDRRTARAELRVARAKVNEIVDAANDTADLITNKALDKAATTRAEAELDAQRLQLTAERERLAAEREQLAAARARLAAEMHQARSAIERERQTAGLAAERAQLQSEANLQEARRKLEEAESTRRWALTEALKEATAIKDRARQEANAILSEAQRRVQRTYPVDPAAHPPNSGVTGSQDTSPGTELVRTAGTVMDHAPVPHVIFFASHRTRSGGAARDENGQRSQGRFGLWWSRFRSFARRTGHMRHMVEPAPERMELSAPTWVKSVVCTSMVAGWAPAPEPDLEVVEVELSAERPTELADLDFARVSGELQ